ncbi:MAG: hypothetical protein GEU71_03140 [Actinobacteria bacterium]|nr:hypothetical protein [Actinomycetota bacterium]
MESTKRSTRKSWLAVVAGIAAIALIGAPVVQAATQSVKVKGKVKIAASNGQNISASPVASMGLLSAPGSSGAVDVRTYGGGGGFYGTGVCNTTHPFRPFSTTVAAGADNVITGILLTGTDAMLTVTAPDLDTIIGPAPVQNFRTDATNPNFSVALGNGLSVFPSELVFTCTGWDGGEGSGDYVIIGQ